jgi:hypothetical protein
VNYIASEFGRQKFSESFREGAEVFRDVCIWLMVAITIYSGFGYVQKAVGSYRATTSV